MFFLKTFLLLPGHLPILDVSWSLSYELYFYVLFAAMVFIINNKLQPWAFLLLLVASTVITILNVTPLTIKGTALHFFAGQNLWEFLLGVLCAHLFARVSMAKNIAAGGAIVMVSLFITLSIKYAQPISFLVYGALSFMVVVFFTQFEKTAPFNPSAAKLMQSAGDASYAIYLTGPVVIALMQPTSTLQKTIALIIIVTAALYINQLVEHPLLHLSRRVLLGYVTGRKVAGGPRFK